MNKKILAKMKGIRVVVLGLVLLFGMLVMSVADANAQSYPGNPEGFRVRVTLTEIVCRDTEEGFSGTDEIYVETDLYGGRQRSSGKSWTYDMDRGDVIPFAQLTNLTIRHIPLNSGLFGTIKLKEDDSGFWDGDDTLGTINLNELYLSPQKLNDMATRQYPENYSYWLYGTNNGDSYSYKLSFEIRVELEHQTIRVG